MANTDRSEEEGSPRAPRGAATRRRAASTAASAKATAAKRSAGGQSGSASPLSDGDLARLVGTLQSQQQLAGEAYPPTLAWLLSLAGMSEALAAVIAKDGRAKKVLAFTSKENATPAEVKAAFVALAQDRETLGASPAVLVGALQTRTTRATQLFTLLQLAQVFNAKTQSTFKHAWTDGVSKGHLPEGVGSLRLKGRAYLFLMENVIGASSPELAGRQASTPEPRETGAAAQAREGSEPDPSIEQRILAAFDELDVKGGRKNQVTLAELRRELRGVAHEELEAAIHQLRRARKMTLESSDGRHERLGEEVLAAAIVEDGHRMVYIARVLG